MQNIANSRDILQQKKTLQILTRLSSFTIIKLALNVHSSEVTINAPYFPSSSICRQLQHWEKATIKFSLPTTSPYYNTPKSTFFCKAHFYYSSKILQLQAITKMTTLSSTASSRVSVNQQPHSISFHLFCICFDLLFSLLLSSKNHVFR